MKQADIMAMYLLSAPPSRTADALAVAAEIARGGQSVVLDCVSLIGDRLSETAFLYLAQHQGASELLCDAVLCLPLCSCAPVPYLFQPGQREPVFPEFPDLPVVLADEQLIHVNGLEVSIFRWELGGLSEDLDIRIANPSPVVHE